MIDKKNIIINQDNQQINKNGPGVKAENKLTTSKDNNILEIDQPGEQKWPTLFKILDSNTFGTIVTILTIYALFADDVRVMAFNKNADIVFDIISILCLIVFSTEIAISCLVKQGYVLSFFFWLDIISTLSMILDIQLISNALFFSSTAASTAQLARAGRASRVGTKAGRVVRLVRLIRIVKLYKAAQDSQEKKGKNKKTGKKFMQQKFKQIQEKKQINLSSGNAIKHDDTKKQQNGDDPDNEIDDDEIDEQEKQASNNNIDENQEEILEENQDFKESKVSKILSDLTTKRVIIIVLLLLFVMPLFTSDYFYDYPDPFDYSMTLFKDFCQNPQFNIQDMQNYYQVMINQTLSNLAYPLVQFQGPFTFTPLFQDPSFSILRDSEKNVAQYNLDEALFLQNHPTYQQYLDSSGVRYFISVVNIQASQILDSGLSLGRTIFVCIVLTMGALFFSKDANDLALRPIERMMHKVQNIARNPLLAKEQKLLKSKGEDQYETTIIENAIIKIGVLLALGFGDAGSEIIGSNMKQLGDVNPMIPGKKTVAIYGFCDIRNFTDATEQLQKDVMVFVNSIGEVVHTLVDRFNGAANKNIGDAFLLVWKLPIKQASVNDKNEITYYDMKWMGVQADFSAISFMKIQSKINRKRNVLDYRKDTRLTSRMPGYKVKIGYGLHIGWSIEGAIGSDYKIDASYLSPNVNMSARLEGGTKLYGITILITSSLADLFTQGLKDIVRQIDCVECKGFPTKFGLYTVDMNVDVLEPCGAEQNLSKEQLYKIEKNRKVFLQNYLEHPGDWNPYDYILNNKELRMMLFEPKHPQEEQIRVEKEKASGNLVEYKEQDYQLKNQPFRKDFDDGMEYYIKGRWTSSKQKLEKAQQYLQSKGINPDPPSQVIMEFMAETNYKPPDDWKGYRFNSEL